MFCLPLSILTNCLVHSIRIQSRAPLLEKVGSQTWCKRIDEFHWIQARTCSSWFSGQSSSLLAWTKCQPNSHSNEVYEIWMDFLWSMVHKTCRLNSTSSFEYPSGVVFPTWTTGLPPVLYYCWFVRTSYFHQLFIALLETVHKVYIYIYMCMYIVYMKCCSAPLSLSFPSTLFP